MARVLVAERIASAGLDVLHEAGHETDVRLGMSPAELLDAVAGAQALIIRSATQVTAEVLEAGEDLVVVGRAGVGLDNVDLAAATRLGVTVVNAPLSNVLSAAEHTVALILSQARNIPQAHAALVAGRWERAKWEGIELAGKTLGIIGLGRVGRLVAERVAGFAMLTLAHDPYVSAEQARELRIELVSLPELMARSDFVTVHVARTPETIGLIGADLLASAKPGIRIVNVARGGLVDEEALAEALRSGRVAGAALDVFDGEPVDSSPLFGLPGVVVTPHLGASTGEAQHRAGVNIAEQVTDALAGGFVPFAVNIEAGQAPDILRPYLPLCEHMGGMLAEIVGGLPEEVELEFWGHIGDHDPSIARLAVLKGLLASARQTNVTYVNAPLMAAEAGLRTVTHSHVAPRDFLNEVVVRGGGTELVGTLLGVRGDPYVVKVNGVAINVRPSRHMVMITNEDRPGIVGAVGTILGEAGVNIADMVLDCTGGRSSISLIMFSTDRHVPEAVAQRLRDTPGVLTVTVIRLGTIARSVSSAR